MKQKSQSKNPNYASQPEAPMIVPDLCHDRFVCGVTAIVFQRWWCRWPRVAGRGRDRFGTMGGHLSVSTHICTSSNSSKFLREPGNVNNGRVEELFHLAQVRMWVVFIPEIMEMASATRESFFPAHGGWWLVVASMRLVRQVQTRLKLKFCTAGPFHADCTLLFAFSVHGKI